MCALTAKSVLLLALCLSLCGLSAAQVQPWINCTTSDAQRVANISAVVRTNGTTNQYKTCYSYTIKAWTNDNDASYYVQQSGYDTSSISACSAYVQTGLIAPAVLAIRASWWGASVATGYYCCDSNLCNYRILSGANGSPMASPLLVAVAALVSGYLLRKVVA